MKRKQLWIVAGFILFVVILFNSCTYHSKDIQYPNNPSSCDTAAVTYSASIIPLFSSYCYSCHSGNALLGAGIKLDQYNIAKAYALSGQMLKAVRHEGGVEPMPQGAAKLSDCNIAKIRIWMEAGAPNN